MANKCTLKILALGLLLISLTGCQMLSNDSDVAQAAIETNPIGVNQMQSPAIQDATILEGWNILRSLREPIEANGVVVSGESLAQYLVENQIPVVWGKDEICGGASCSRMYCTPDGDCSYEDGQPGIDPIYLNPTILSHRIGQKERLAGELAHEIYHRMSPFGAGRITQVEEYWAFYVGAKVVKADFPKFDGVDPYDPEQLQSWFYAHSLIGYLKLAAYPGGIAPSAQAANTSHDIVSE